MGKKPNNFWTFEQVMYVAKQCRTKKEFRIKHHGAYLKSVRNGWNDSVCSHMEPLGNLKYRYVYVIVGQVNKIVYFGLSKDINQRFKEHVKNDLLSKFLGDIPKLVKISELLPVDEAATLERKLIEDFKKLDYVVLNKSEGGEKGGGTPSITFNDCLLAAKNFNYRGDFQKGARAEYSKAHRAKWLDEICTHMSYRQRPNGTLTQEHCAEIAKTFDFRSYFQKGAPSEYREASTRGWLDEICAHMPKRKKRS